LLTASQGYSIEMTVIIAGDRMAATTLAGGDETAAEATVWTHEPTAGRGSVGALAEALIGFEAAVSGQQVDSIVLADDSDAALAAALVGTKLPVEVFAAAQARETASVNGRLIAQLAAAYTAPA
jgi:hypothetical protein